MGEIITCARTKAQLLSNIVTKYTEHRKGGTWNYKSHTAFHIGIGDDHGYILEFSLFIHSFCIKTLTRETAEPSFRAAGWSATFLYWSGAAEEISFLRGKSAGIHYQVVIQSDDGDLTTKPRNGEF